MHLMGRGKAMSSRWTAAGSFPTVSDVEQIAVLPDPVVRNLRITQSYHELATAMVPRTGLCANWCTFATWASKQAGQTIRKEDVPRMLEAILFSAQAVEDVTAQAQALGSRQTEAEIQVSLAEVLNPLAAFDRASDAVSRGNRKVYAEIGREFARFYASCLYDEHYDAVNIGRFCESLRSGPPPKGQQHLRSAFQHYYQAFFETDPHIRAQLILLANIQIGAHEQTRLQPEIAEALDAAFVDPREFRLRLIRALFPYRGWLARVRMFLLRLFGQPNRLDTLLNTLVAEARRRSRLLITEYIMTLDLPGQGRVRLGEDHFREFPETLHQITLSDLVSLLEQIDPTPDSTRDSGAVDWADLPDRLHFIIDLFRCCHETVELFDPPFTESQVRAMKAGQVPEGRL